MFSQQIFLAKNKMAVILFTVGAFSLVGLGVGGFFLSPVLATIPEPDIYPRVEDISIKTSIVWSKSDSEVIKARAVIKPLIGTLSAVKVLFYSTPDLMIDEPAEFNLGSINQGEIKNLEVSVRRSGKESSLGLPTIDINVSYYPDYEKIMQTIKNSPDEYPDEDKREKLLEFYMERQKDKEREVEARAENFFDGFYREDDYPFKDLMLKQGFAPREKKETPAISIVVTIGVLLLMGLGLGGFFSIKKLKKRQDNLNNK